MTKIPPAAKGDEMERAMLTLKRMRRLIEKADLPWDWQEWVARSLWERYVGDDEADGK